MNAREDRQIPFWLIVAAIGIIALPVSLVYLAVRYVPTPEATQSPATPIPLPSTFRPHQIWSGITYRLTQPNGWYFDIKVADKGSSCTDAVVQTNAPNPTPEFECLPDARNVLYFDNHTFEEEIVLDTNQGAFTLWYKEPWELGTVPLEQ